MKRIVHFSLSFPESHNTFIHLHVAVEHLRDVGQTETRPFSSFLWLFRVLQQTPWYQFTTWGVLLLPKGTSDCQQFFHTACFWSVRWHKGKKSLTVQKSSAAKDREALKKVKAKHRHVTTYFHNFKICKSFFYYVTW